MADWRIMVVDDEEDIREMLSTTLGMKYEVVEAHDGLDALDKLKRYQPDFIIMDVMMPLMNGLDASLAVRENPDFNHVPILFLSAFSTKENMQKAYRSGADLFLAKPVEPVRLLQTVENFLKKNKYPPMEKDLSMEEIKKLEKGEESPEESRAPSAKEAIEKGEKSLDEGEKKSRFEKIAAGTHQPKHRASPYNAKALKTQPRVMIIDDEEEMIEFIRLSLKGDYEVVFAMDGLEGIKKVVTYQPDVFILDIMLPKMSGYQICQSIRRNRTYRSAPVLMISAKSSSKDQKYAFRMGADSFLPKPFTSRDLQKSLEDVIRKRGMVVRQKNLTMADIEAQENKDEEERKPFEEQEARLLKKKDESEIQKLLREQIDREENK